MSNKIHYQHSPDYFDGLNEEHWELFHQDIKTMKERYQGRWTRT